MRALFMDFPNDPKVGDLGDEYMFGPAFLVAPVTEQGATSRTVYLPAGSDWYDYWTNQQIYGRPDALTPPRRSTGSRCSCAPARSCRWACRCQSTATHQALSEFRVYPGRDAISRSMTMTGRPTATKKARAGPRPCLGPGDEQAVGDRRYRNDR